jgi:D-glycero-D-manno-heptose 1,7-bisphosphate phosphatase
MQRTIFLDRDGVINDYRRHVNKPEDIFIYEKSKEGLKKAYEAGYDLYIVTNQGGIELGFMSHGDLERIHEHLIKELKPYCEIKDIKYCPDFKKESTCRKPDPGMIIELGQEYNLDLQQCWMVGDMETDIEAGRRAGCKTAKIGKKSIEAYINGEDLLEVVNQIIEWDNRSS